MPSRAIVNYMHDMTQLGATPQQIEAGLLNAASFLTIAWFAIAIVFGLYLLVNKVKATR